MGRFSVAAACAILIPSSQGSSKGSEGEGDISLIKKV
jgi:hypothetical protein